MQKIIELFALLMLALFGFVTPLLAIILSIFSQGLSKLSQQYEAERTQTEEKLKNQLQKIGEAPSLDLKEIKQTVRELQTVKKYAERKLQMLTPKKALIFTCAPLITAFIVCLPSFIEGSHPYYKYLIIISLVLVGYSIKKMWQILDILIEITSLLDSESRDEKRMIPELLSEIVKNTKEGVDQFIEDVYVELSSVPINKDKNTLDLIVNKKVDLPLSIHNNDLRMAKVVETGFVFPIDFLIEKKAEYTIYSSGSSQIVRYSRDRIHGSTYYIETPLTLTPLKQGQYVFDVFVKGENIKSIYRKLTINVK